MGNIPGVLAAHINSCLAKTLHKAKRKGGKIWCTKKVEEVHRQASSKPGLLMTGTALGCVGISA